MGLFNPNYDKPGVGIRKDEPEKKGAALYWELFSRKWRSYVLLNILYAVTGIPAFLYYLIIVSGLMTPGEGSDAMKELMSISGMIAAFMVIFFSGSPFKSGFCYVLRNFVRQEHAWTVGDFFGKTFENFKQSVAAFVIDTVAGTAILFAIKYYFVASQTNKWMAVFFAVVICLTVLYVIMQSFLWQMMVTFRLNIAALYKNSYLLSMATIPINLLSLIIRVAVIALLFFSSYLSYLLILAIFISAESLLEHMLAYPTLKKFMLDKAEKNEVTENDNP